MVIFDIGIWLVRHVSKWIVAVAEKNNANADNKKLDKLPLSYYLHSCSGLALTMGVICATAAMLLAYKILPLLKDIEAKQWEINIFYLTVVYSFCHGVLAKTMALPVASIFRQQLGIAAGLCALAFISNNLFTPHNLWVSYSEGLFAVFGTDLMLLLSTCLFCSLSIRQTSFDVMTAIKKKEQHRGD